MAAAADLQFAMDELIDAFKEVYPGEDVTVVYGSSGKFFTQIQFGAPFDLYFSADIEYPRELESKGFAATAVRRYAVGRLVLWSSSTDAPTMSLNSLRDRRITRIAIANPQHAPYGKRAEEALRAAGHWEQVKSKLVYGESVAQAAQYIQTGSADVGIIALSLALSPEMANRGGYWLIPDHLHSSLVQGYVVLRRAADNELAHRFAEYIASLPARAVLSRYGFVLPEEDLHD